MEGDSAGILRAGERENTDQAEKDGGNVIHQTNCGRKGGENTRSAERETVKTERKNPGPLVSNGIRGKPTFQALIRFIPDRTVSVWNDLQGLWMNV